MTTPNSFAGGANPTALTALMTDTATGTFGVVNATGWPTGRFTVVIDAGTATAEKLVCIRNGNTFTIVSRGYDGTIAAQHESGAPVTHVLDATTIQRHDDYVVANNAGLLSGESLARLDYLRRAQMLAHHSIYAGPVRWTGTHLGWSDRIIMLGAGTGGVSGLDRQGGWLGLWVPAVGTVVQGHNSAPDITVVAAGFLVRNHAALYYDPVLDRYHHVGYGGATFVVPSLWILVAHRSESDDRIWVCSEGLVDYWRRPPLLNGWAVYDTTFTEPGYRMDNGGVVHLQGMLKNGTIGQPMFTLPAGYRPIRTQLFTAITNQALGRLDVLPGGAVTPTLGGNPWFSIDGLTFFAEQ